MRLLLTLVCVVLLGPAARACTLTRLATVPLSVIDGRILLTVAVDGQSATFQLDTGADLSLVTPEAAHRLKLRRDPWIGATVAGVGGIERRAVADPRSLALAGLPLRHDDPRGDATLAVASIAAPRVGGLQVDGLLGRDFLRAFDAEIDLATRRLVLWRVRGCAGAFLPLTELGPAGYDRVPAMPAYGDALVIPVLVNATLLRALPDTGAAETLLTDSGTIRLGLGHGGRVRFVGGVGGAIRMVSGARLATVRIGGQTRHDVAVLATSLHVMPITDMLLGADWFARHPVWLSYATRQIFFGR